MGGESVKKKYLDVFWVICKYAILAFMIAIVIRGFLLIPVPVEGNSMEKTLDQGDMVLVEKISPIRRFDVVVFQLPSGTTYIKRVIGLPGDVIAYKQDQLYINGKPVDEPFLTKNRRSDSGDSSYTNDFSLQELTGEVALGENSYFVLGDNRRVSKDSRSFGSIQNTDILGKARIVYYPLPHWKFIA
ncbi:MULTISPECIES: signal peptidase I [Enterococcus]|uniref:signal peptidase I n=1 Tax=Enterococcus TaxID=1350 RepID=UPI0008599D5F|nr:MULTISPECIES: signal peptidase I [Enterococcus]